MKFIAYNTVSIIFAIIAGYMIYTDKPDYGWLIFAAMLSSVSVTTTRKSK